MTDEKKKLIWPIAKLRGWAQNPRKIDADGLARLKNQIQKLGQYKPLPVTADGTVLGGNMRLRAYKELGITEAWVSVVDAPDDQSKLEYALSDNDRAGSYDQAALEDLVRLSEIDLAAYAVDLGEAMTLEALLAADDLEIVSDGKGNLAAEFGVPPLSVLNANSGWWRERKKVWRKREWNGVAGRGDNLYTGISDQSPGIYNLRNAMRERDGRDPSWDEIAAEAGNRGIKMLSGTSTFDPVLCELVYRWFCPPGGTTLDPFAGGCTGGIVAAQLGRSYTGVDLLLSQVEANVEQWENWPGKKDYPPPAWIHGDSRHIRELLGEREFDLLYSCPPYAFLEKYSDDPRDLSAMKYEEFLPAYREIVLESCAMLKPDRFAVFVVGEVRDKAGNYIGFVPDTIRAFEDAGLRFYNEAILVGVIASAAIRCGKQFRATRKLGKIHQQVLVFVKGDPKKATKAIGDVPFGKIEGEEDAETA